MTVISDYAHHPTAVRVTLERCAPRPASAICGRSGSRTPTGGCALAGEFATAFAAADRAGHRRAFGARDGYAGLDAAGMAAQSRVLDTPMCAILAR